METTLSGQPAGGFFRTLNTDRDNADSTKEMIFVIHKKMFLRILFLAVFLSLALHGSGTAFADHSKSGTVRGTYAYTYTVKCNPGDSFAVSVRSDYPTSVSIASMTFEPRAPGGWGYNKIAASNKRTSHLLKHRAPDGRPKNNAAYWHYKVYVRAATKNPAQYSLRIEQRGNGRQNQSGRYVARAKKQILNLGKAIMGKQKQLNSEAKSRNARIQALRRDLKNKKSSLDAERSRLRQMANGIRSERNKAVRSSMIQKYKSREASFNSRVKGYNQVNGQVKRLLSENKELKTRWTELQNLGKSINDAWKRNDIDRCILIANGSRLARSLGWQTMKR